MPPPLPNYHQPVPQCSNPLPPQPLTTPLYYHQPLQQQCLQTSNPYHHSGTAINIGQHNNNDCRDHNNDDKHWGDPLTWQCSDAPPPQLHYCQPVPLLFQTFRTVSHDFQVPTPTTTVHLPWLPVPPVPIPTTTTSLPQASTPPVWNGHWWLPTPTWSPRCQPPCLI